MDGRRRILRERGGTTFVVLMLSVSGITFAVPANARAAATSEAATDAQSSREAFETQSGSHTEVTADEPAVTTFEGDAPGAPTALAAGSGAIAGTVVADGTGTPLGGVCVDADTPSGPFVARATTAANGTYLIGGLATGSYKVKFNGCNNPSYAVEFYDNKPGLSAGNLLTVTDGLTTSGINAGLAVGGSISGTIVADGTGSALSGICVSALLTGGDFVTSSSSGADGTYILGGLAAGSYKIRFSDCVGSVDYAAEVYDNKLDVVSGNPVPVTAGATTSGINASLGIAGSISGNVVADGTGTPLAGICVSPVIPSTGSSNFRFNTAADGTYLMTGLAAGTYKVRFQDCVGSADYATEFYDNKQGLNPGNPVSVAPGATTSGINASLGIAGSIAGTVVADGTGSPLAGICVSALTSNGDFIASATSAPDGTYTITGLAGGSYKVRFQDCVTPIDYALEYYDNKLDLPSGNSVSVTAGATTSGINAGLGIAGNISGTVVAGGTGAPLADICVFPVNPASGTSSFRFSTAANGTYLMTGLAAGTYKVRFSDCVGTVDYAAEYFDDKLTLNTAASVSVAAGVTTLGINAVLGLAGSISGTVVADGTGSPLAGICVAATLSTGDTVASNQSAANGTYTIAGLAVTTYKVRFQDCVNPVDYALEFYENKTDPGAANSVTVTAGATTTGINASLGIAGSISGTVVADGTGSPLAGICVSPFVAATGWANVRFFTAANGTYTLVGLAPGSYKVRFQDCNGTVDHRTEFYDNKPDISVATLVSVSAGATTAGINAGLAASLAVKRPADFDGDGDTDRSVYRNGAWYAEGQDTAFIGNATDIPVHGDYDNDGRSDKAVYREGAWFTQGQANAFLGLSGDIPVPGDYNGDGRTERAVFRPSVGAWYVEGQPAVFHGSSGDIPVPGDYNGNGTTDFAVFRPSVGGWYIQGQATVFTGLSGDIPVPGDYDGNGTTDIAVFRPAVGGWYTNGQATVFTGLSGDIPEPGDYDGNGMTDRAIWRKAVGGWYTSGQATVFLGISGDIPLPLPQAIYRAFFTP